MYDYGYSYGYGLIGGNTYNPLINYDWSTTTTSGLRYLKDVGSTPTYDASMYFGRGAYLNGVDQSITVPINTTIQTSLKRVNGVITINETSQTLTNYVISGLGVHKDYYLFTRLLTTSEKESYTNTPELFYAMAQADNTCVLNMPMCETSSTARNYRTGIDYPITNYTSSVRDNAKNLQYGLQTCKFVRDGLGVIQSASDYLECDGVGYVDTGWIPSADEDWTLELVQNISPNTTFQISGTTVSGDSRFFIGSDATGKVVANLGGVSKYSLVQLGNRHIVLSYEASTKQYILYLNGVPLGITSTPSFVTGSVNFTLGNVQLSFEVATEIRLFKVHPKALTQDEVTKAYTDAVNKGLLS